MHVPLNNVCDLIKLIHSNSKKKVENRKNPKKK